MSIKDKAIYWDFIFNRNYNIKFFGNHTDNTNCTICEMEIKNNYTIKLPCGDKFHRNCFYEQFFKYNKHYCPKCHIKVEKKDESINLNNLMKS